MKEIYKELCEAGDHICRTIEMLQAQAVARPLCKQRAELLIRAQWVKENLVKSVEVVTNIEEVEQRVELEKVLTA